MQKVQARFAEAKISPSQGRYADIAGIGINDIRPLQPGVRF